MNEERKDSVFLTVCLNRINSMCGREETDMSLLQMSFSGGVMILTIIVVRALAINRLPKKVFGLLWGAVLLRLLIPFSVPTILSAYSLVNRNRPIQDALSDTPMGYMIPQMAAVQAGVSVSTADVVSDHVLPFSGWMFLWAIGVALCAAYFAVSYMRGLLEFRTSLPVRNEFAANWLSDHRLRRHIQIRQSDRISAPLTYGILRPVILMPKKTDWEDELKLKYVLSHEFVHIRRFDMVWKLISALALCIHWFNPLVWAMYILFNRDIELSCDESVVRSYGERSKSVYAMTLLTMEEKKSGLMPLCNNFSKNAIEERITAIMKIKRITLWAIMMSAAVFTAVVVLFATTAEGKPLSDADDPQKNMEGMTADGIEAPEEVLDAAQRLVGQMFSDAQDEIYSNWRIESLKHVYTYEDFDGMTLQVWQMNYEFFAEDPQSVNLVGGMSMDEEGWVVPEYPNSTYLIFSWEGNSLSYLTSLFENDCFPGDEVFSGDLRRMMDVSNAQGTEDDAYVRAEKTILQYSLAGGMEKMPVTLYVGDGFSIYVPDEAGWNIYDETLDSPYLMAAVYSSAVSIDVSHYTGEKVEDVMEGLLSDGYTYDSDTGKFQRFTGPLDELILEENRVYGQDNDVWVVGSRYLTEVEFGSRLNAIADTFAITVNGKQESLPVVPGQEASTGDASEELEDLMTAFCQAYFAGDVDAVRNYVVEDYGWSIDVYGDLVHADEVEILRLKGPQAVNVPDYSESYDMSLEFRIPDEDSLTYLSATWVRENDSWKIKGYGLEK